MKRILSYGILIFLSALNGRSLMAQTNTFPSSGNAGVGTTSPAFNLEVDGKIGVINTTDYDGSTGNPFGVGRNVVPGDTFLGIGTNQTNHYSYIQSQDAGIGYYDLLLNPNGGNLGIGTRSPAAKFHVQANDLSWYQGIFENLSPNTDGGGIQFRNDETGSSGQGGVILMGSSGNYYTSYQKRFSIVSYANGPAGTGSSGITLSMEGASEGPQDVRITNGNQLSGTVFIVTSSGNVGIGTTTPAYPLSVNGTVEAKEVIVQTGWSDFVFDKDYRLSPLAEVEQSIAKDKHLPGMPSAGEVASHGVSVGEMDAKLLQKIEELTLYTIQLQKENDALRERVTALEAKSP